MTQNLIVTGIPRSGTSYLCNLLHRFDDCVALNEPPGLYASIRARDTEPGIRDYLLQIRQAINSGKPVLNKIRNGSVSEDTRFSNQLTEYCPAVASAGFLLAVKGTLIVLNNIERVRTAMPGVRIVACVRDPVDTIASWKTSFPHLRNADVLRAFANREEQTGPLAADEEIRAIASIERVADRRAAWWAYLARIVRRASRSGATVVHYDALVLEPLRVLREVVGSLCPGELREPVVPSQLRSQRQSLSVADVAAIEKYCLDSARELGISVNLPNPTEFARREDD